MTREQQELNKSTLPLESGMRPMVFSTNAQSSASNNIAYARVIDVDVQDAKIVPDVVSNTTLPISNQQAHSVAPKSRFVSDAEDFKHCAEVFFCGGAIVVCSWFASGTYNILAIGFGRDVVSNLIDDQNNIAQISQHANITKDAQKAFNDCVHHYDFNMGLPMLAMAATLAFGTAALWPRINRLDNNTLRALVKGIGIELQVAALGAIVGYFSGMLSTQRCDAQADHPEHTVAKSAIGGAVGFVLFPLLLAVIVGCRLACELSAEAEQQAATRKRRTSP